MWRASDGQHLSGQRYRAIWMQTSGTALLAAERCSLVRMWMAAQDSRSTHGLLYFAAVRDDRHHLIRSDLQPGPLPAHPDYDQPKYGSTVRSRWRR
jgi:hypothetical protein